MRGLLLRDEGKGGWGVKERVGREGEDGKERWEGREEEGRARFMRTGPPVV